MITKTGSCGKQVAVNRMTRSWWVLSCHQESWIVTTFMNKSSPGCFLR